MIETLILIGKVLGIIAAGTIAIGTIHIKLIRPVFKTISKYISKVDRIFNEVTPNGGESLKDGINRIEDKIDTFYQENKLLSDYIPIGFWRLDSKGHCIWVNQHLKDMVDHDRDESFIGNNWVGIIHEDDRDKLLKELSQSIAQERFFKMTVRLVKFNNEIITVSIKNTAIVDRRKHIIGYLGSIVPTLQIEDGQTPLI